jgi:putative membrane protein
MRDLARRFLSGTEREKVIAAVKAAEKLTSGEIVPMVVSASYRYPMADVIGGAAFALPISLILTPLVGGWLWLGTQNLWLFLGVFAILFIAFHEIVKRTYWLKRWFISQREIDEEVEEAAVTSFFTEGLYRSRDETGVLVFISVFEHKVWILADRGINEKVPEGQWNDIVTIIVDGIKQKRQTESICDAVEKIGAILQEHFPIKPNDTDELKNLIVDER